MVELILTGRDEILGCGVFFFFKRSRVSSSHVEHLPVSSGDGGVSQI